MDGSWWDGGRRGDLLNDFGDSGVLAIVGVASGCTMYIDCIIPVLYDWHRSALQHMY